MKNAFSEFTLSHEKVVTKEPDENVDHVKDFDDVEANYVSALCKAKSVKHKVASSIQSTVSGHDSEMLGLLSLPKVELEVFS